MNEAITITLLQPTQADLARAVSKAVRENFPGAVGGPNTIVNLCADEAGNKSLVAHNIANGWSVIIHADGEVSSDIPNTQMLSIMYNIIVNYVAPSSGSHGAAAQAEASSSNDVAPAPDAPVELDGVTLPVPADFS